MQIFGREKILLALDLYYYDKKRHQGIELLSAFSLYISYSIPVTNLPFPQYVYT